MQIARCSDGEDRRRRVMPRRLSLDLQFRLVAFYAGRLSFAWEFWDGVSVVGCVFFLCKCRCRMLETYWSKEESSRSFNLKFQADEDACFWSASRDIIESAKSNSAYHIDLLWLTSLIYFDFLISRIAKLIRAKYIISFTNIKARIFTKCENMLHIVYY